MCISHNKRKADESIGRCLKETTVISNVNIVGKYRLLILGVDHNMKPTLYFENVFIYKRNIIKGYMYYFSINYNMLHSVCIILVPKCFSLNFITLFHCTKLSIPCSGRSSYHGRKWIGMTYLLSMIVDITFI